MVNNDGAMRGLMQRLRGAKESEVPELLEEVRERIRAEEQDRGTDCWCPPWKFYDFLTGEEETT